MKTHIKKSPRLMRIKVIFVAIVVLFTVLLSLVILHFMDGFVAANTTGISVLIMIIILLVATSAVLVTWLRGKSRQYILEDNKLTIVRGFLSKQEKIVTLGADSILNLNLSQSFFGEMLNYGTVTIEINTYSGKESYALSDIDNPKAIFSEIDKFASSKSEYA